MGLNKLMDGARTTLGASAILLAATTASYAEQAGRVCDTTGFSHADGTPNTTGSTRGAMYKDGRKLTVDGMPDGRACSVPLELYNQREGGDERTSPSPETGGGDTGVDETNPDGV